MIEITTSLVLLASAFISAPATTTPATASSTVSENATSSVSLTSVSVEAYVRDYFKDAPVLAEVAKCESTFRQFDSQGRIIRGKVNPDDVGVMQINTFYHGESAEKLGYDLYTIDGNLGFARWLYGKYGSDPWVHSSKCWKKSAAYAQVAMK
jgi:hypothetical protein